MHVFSVAHSCLNLCNLITVDYQAPLSMGFPRQQHWNMLPFPTPGDLPDPETEPISVVSPALAGRFFTNNTTWEVTVLWY